MKKRYKLLLFLLVAFVISAIPELLYKNQGESNSIGTRAHGSLENGYLLPYFGKNFAYFSPLSYYCANNAYTNARCYQSILDAYQTCEKTCPDTYFHIMETSDKYGGSLAIHRTHQHGLSADFMVPKVRKGSQSRVWDVLGYWHYLLDFDNDGKLFLQKSVEIDFEAMAKHILALDDAAKKNDLRITMVILKIELKDDFYKTKSGQEVQTRGIYFARSLPYWTNRVHDDHYHVDFALR